MLQSLCTLVGPCDWFRAMGVSANHMWHFTAKAERSECNFSMLLSRFAVVAGAMTDGQAFISLNCRGDSLEQSPH